MSPGNPFILGSKGQLSRWRGAKALSAWVLVLLWVLAFSSLIEHDSVRGKLSFITVLSVHKLQNNSIISSSIYCAIIIVSSFSGSISRMARPVFLDFSAVGFRGFRTIETIRCTDLGEIWRRWVDSSTTTKTVNITKSGNVSLAPFSRNFQIYGQLRECF